MRSATGYIIAVLIALLSYSCGSSRRVSSSVRPATDMPAYAEAYIERYAPLAVTEMRRTGIPASITLAQGMLESDYGRSTLARKGNNHFGIKCHSTWNGGKIYHDDNRRNECFRSYRSAEDSYRDHSDFLVTGSRYKDLFRLSATDYKGWAHGLKKAGYATNPDYPSLLIRKIEEYGLHAYDVGAQRKNSVAKASEVPSSKTATQGENRNAVSETGEVPAKASADTAPVPSSGTDTSGDYNPDKVITFGTGRTGETNRVQYIIVRDGDTRKSLAEEFDLLAWEINRYNELPGDTPLVPGQVIYLQPKRNKADVGNNVHAVMEGETMYMISQKYAVKLSSLYKMNMMEEGTECTPGQKLKLR